MLTLFCLLIFASFDVLARAESSSLYPNSSSVVSLVHEFKNKSCENLYARSNGHLIVSFTSDPLIYGLDPTDPDQPPTLVHRFSGVTSVLGIAETAPDVFAVVAGNWTKVTMHQPGSFSLWSIDMKSPNNTKVKLITGMPKANGLNGVTALGGRSPDIVLVADSVLGALWRVNIKTGDYSIAIKSPLFANENEYIGINGVRSFGGSVYFTNSAQGIYGRVPVTYNGSAAGEVEKLAEFQLPSILDDLDLDWEGDAWIATHPNALSEVTMEGKRRNITGDASLAIVQPVSARFGQSQQQKRTLYVATAGNGTVGGQVIAVNTCLD